MSYQTVYKATFTGRLRESFEIVDGKRTIRDVELADREWTAGKPTGGPVLPARMAPVAPLPPPAEWAPQKAAALIARAKPTWEIEGEAAGVAPPVEPIPVQVFEARRYRGQLRSEGEGFSLDEAIASEKFWAAQQRELKVREKAGELIQAAQVESAITTMVVAARTKLLGLSTRAKQKLPHLAPGDLTTIDAIVRELLDDLSRSSLEMGIEMQEDPEEESEQDAA